MACCPFHEDHHPSMKLDERFHCFGCGADGDVIDFAARLFRLPVKEAAERLAADFGIAPGIPGPPPPPRKKSPAEECREVLLEMETMLHRQKRLTAPQSAGDPITIEYAKNCQMYDYIVCLADLLSGGTEQERQDCVTYLMGGMLARFKRALQKGEITDDDVF